MNKLYYNRNCVDVIKIFIDLKNRELPTQVQWDPIAIKAQLFLHLRVLEKTKEMWKEKKLKSCQKEKNLMCQPVQETGSEYCNPTFVKLEPLVLIFLTCGELFIFPCLT